MSTLLLKAIEMMQGSIMSLIGLIITLFTTIIILIVQVIAYFCDFFVTIPDVTFLNLNWQFRFLIVIIGFSIFLISGGLQIFQNIINERSQGFWVFFKKALISLFFIVFITIFLNSFGQFFNKIGSQIGQIVATTNNFSPKEQVLFYKSPFYSFTSWALFSKIEEPIFVGNFEGIVDLAIDMSTKYPFFSKYGIIIAILLICSMKAYFQIFFSLLSRWVMLIIHILLAPLIVAFLNNENAEQNVKNYFKVLFANMSLTIIYVIIIGIAMFTVSSFSQNLQVSTLKTLINTSPVATFNLSEREKISQQATIENNDFQAMLRIVLFFGFIMFLANLKNKAEGFVLGQYVKDNDYSTLATATASMIGLGAGIAGISAKNPMASAKTLGATMAATSGLGAISTLGAMAGSTLVKTGAVAKTGIRMWSGIGLFSASLSNINNSNNPSNNQIPFEKSNDSLINTSQTKEAPPQKTKQIKPEASPIIPSEQAETTTNNTQPTPQTTTKTPKIKPQKENKLSKKQIKKERKIIARDRMIKAQAGVNRQKVSNYQQQPNTIWDISSTIGSYLVHEVQDFEGRSVYRANKLTASLAPKTEAQKNVEKRRKYLEEKKKVLEDKKLNEPIWDKPQRELNDSNAVTVTKEEDKDDGIPTYSELTEKNYSDTEITIPEPQSLPQTLSSSTKTPLTKKMRF